MWFFEKHDLDNGEQVIRWAFLFAAPTLFNNFESTEFTVLHLFIGIILLVFFSFVKQYLSYLKNENVMDNESWLYYGRIITFFAHIVFNCNVASQIWTGLVISKIVSSMFEYHNNLSVFWSFAISLVLFLSVFQSTMYSVNTLR